MHRPHPNHRASRRLVPALLAAAALLAASPAVRAQTVQLEYKLRPETTYEQVISMTMEITMEMAGVPQDQAAMAEALGQGMSQEMTMTMAMELGPLGDDGTMPVEMRMEDLEAAVVAAGQRMTAPATVAPGTSLMKGRITPGGKMAEMRMEGTQGASQDLVERLLQFLPEFPSVELAVGQSFEIPMSMAVPIPGADLQMEGKAVYTLRDLEAGRATFDLVQAFSMGVDGDQEVDVGGMDMKMEGGGSGTAVFDLAEGIFSEILFDMELSADMKIDPSAMKASGEGEAPAGPMTMKIAAGGPVKVTITRRGS